MYYALQGGPGDRMYVPQSMIHGREIRMTFDVTPRKSFAFFGAVQVQPRNLREAIYLIVDNESAVANWFGWADEVSTANPAMVAALGNATDCEILKLMNKLRAG